MSDGIHYGKHVSQPPDGWPGTVDYDAAIKTWHVYQQKNGYWTVTSEDVNGNLAVRAYNVPTEDEAIRHEAEKMKRNTNDEGEIVVEESHRDHADPERPVPHDFELPRRAGE